MCVLWTAREVVLALSDSAAYHAQLLEFNNQSSWVPRAELLQDRHSTRI